MFVLLKEGETIKKPQSYYALRFLKIDKLLRNRS
jgi:hypothetical protein